MSEVVSYKLKPGKTVVSFLTAAEGTNEINGNSNAGITCIHQNVQPSGTEVTMEYRGLGPTEVARIEDSQYVRPLIEGKIA